MITTMHSDQNASPPRVEVITSIQRRRRWPTAEKIRLGRRDDAARDVGVLRGPASGRRSQLAVQLASTNAGTCRRHEPCPGAGTTGARASSDEGHAMLLRLYHTRFTSRSRQPMPRRSCRGGNERACPIRSAIGKTERMPARPVQHKRSTMPVRSVCDLPRGPNA
jgi:hypothetical protein